MSRPHPVTYVGTVLCLSAIGLGCVPSLNQNKPREANTAVPAVYRGMGGTAGAPSPEAASSGQIQWRNFFRDPQLQVLIQTALTNNQELNIRLQEVIIAKNEIISKQGAYIPKVEADVGAGLEKVGKYTSQGASDEATGLAQNLQDYIFGFSASWEVDIWKKLRNAARSAAYKYLSSLEGRNFMITQLVAEIANSYYELLALDNQVEVLKRNIRIQQDALAVVRLQKQAAKVTRLAVQRFEAEVLKNRSRQFDLEQRRIETQNRINFLIGRFPRAVDRDPKKFRAPLPNVIEAGIPSQLLDNRPDLKQAAQQLAAAELSVQVAKAGFYPALSIAAGVGYEAFNLKHLVMTPESLAYNVAGNLATPLLNRRAIKAEYFSANAEQIRAVFNYERTILQAFTEVANLLAMIKNLEGSYDLQARQVSILEQAIDVSGVLFQSARADYMEVLLTRRDALTAEMELIETKRRQLRAMVDIYQALGGGWKQQTPDLTTQDDVTNALSNPTSVPPQLIPVSQ